MMFHHPIAAPVHLTKRITGSAGRQGRAADRLGGRAVLSFRRRGRAGPVILLRAFGLLRCYFSIEMSAKLMTKASGSSSSSRW